jgi:iron-sulfur cluster repair protein YtfE (RIC family)
MRATQPLRDEHAHLLPRIEDLRRLGDECVEERPQDLLPDVDRALAFLQDELLPHALAEDAVLYPAVAAAMGAPQATATMSRDHEEVAHLIGALARHRDELTSAVAPAAVREIRRLLYALHAVVSLHFAKEEEIYLPLLDERLDPNETIALLHAMHKHAAHPQPSARAS